MAITSKDIDNQSFSVERKGYSIEEVDIFLETVSKEVGLLNDKIEELEFSEKSSTNAASEEKIKELNSIIATQSDKIDKLQAEVKENIDDGRAISEALIVAQRQAEKIVSEANDKSSKIIKDANDKADYIEKEADNQKKKVLGEIDRLEKERAAAKKKYQVMLHDIITAMEKHLDGSEPKPAKKEESINSQQEKKASETSANKPVKAAAVKPAAEIKPETQKDFSGFGDADFGEDKID